VRIIFRAVERSNWTWDPLAGAYYWHLVSKAVYQIGYELVHRREWVRVALETFLSVTEQVDEVRV
jgi:predicted trehalose synthase